MKKRHYPTDSVIYIKAHIYKSIAERLTDADKDNGMRIKKNLKKKCKTILKHSTVLRCTVLISQNQNIYIIIYV